MIVHTCAENIHIRMRLLQGLQTLRRSDNAQELYTAGVTLFDLADGINGAAAGCQHGIQYKHISLTDVARQLAVILYRLQSLLVTIQTDVAHTSGGHQAQSTVYHT